MSVAKSAYHKLKGDENGSTAQAAPVMQREIQVTSKPSGARIEVNRTYVGDAPVHVRVEVDSHGRVTRDYLIRAVPAGKDQYPQKYRLLHYRGEPGDHPPGIITFNMNTPPAR